LCGIQLFTGTATAALVAIMPISKHNVKSWYDRPLMIVLPLVRAAHS
jgi:hypothetical protein